MKILFSIILLIILSVTCTISLIALVFIVSYANPIESLKVILFYAAPMVLSIVTLVRLKSKGFFEAIILDK